MAILEKSIAEAHGRIVEFFIGELSNSYGRIVGGEPPGLWPPAAPEDAWARTRRQGKVRGLHVHAGRGVCLFITADSKRCFGQRGRASAPPRLQLRHEIGII
jgi:hypothetical protein